MVKNLKVAVGCALAMALLWPSSLSSQGAPFTDEELFEMADQIVQVSLLHSQLNHLLWNLTDHPEAITPRAIRSDYEGLASGLEHGLAYVVLDSMVTLNDSVALRVYRFTEHSMHPLTGYLALSQKGIPYRLLGFQKNDVDSLISHCFGGLDKENLFDVAKFATTYADWGGRGLVFIESDHDVEKYKGIYSGLAAPRVHDEAIEKWVTYYTIEDPSDAAASEVMVHELGWYVDTLRYSRIVVKAADTSDE